VPTVLGGLGVAAAANGKLYAMGGNDSITTEEFTLPTEEYGYHILRNLLRGSLFLPQQAKCR